MSGLQSHQDDRGDFGRPAANPSILEFRPEAKVKLYTTPDLIVYEPPGGAWTTFAAFRVEKVEKVEDKGDGVDVSLCVVRLEGPLDFEPAVLDVHGTIRAGINLLHRAFKLEKKGGFLFESGVMPEWEFKAKRVGVKAKRVGEKEDRFDLFVIAHWQEWNEADILWDKRNSIAQSEKSGVSLGPMKLGAFKARYGKRGLKLRYLPGYIG